MSNTTIIAAQIDVCEIVLAALSPQLPEDCGGAGDDVLCAG